MAAASGDRADVRGVRTLLTGIALLLAATVAALWWLPSALDWDRYRGAVEVLAEGTVGEPVSIKGPIQLALLPEPMLTAGRVEIGGSRLAVGELRVRLALGPLLEGRVDARELTFEHPILRLPWPLKPGSLRARPPPWLADFHARIEDGTLTVGNLVFTGVDAALSTVETGALATSGSGRVFGHNWRFSGRLTAPGADGAAGLDFAVDGLAALSGAGGTFSGQLAGDGSLAGQVRAHAPDLSALLPSPPLAFAAEGLLTASSGLAAADDLNLQLGPSAAQAAVALRVSGKERLDIALSTAEIDLNAWLPVLLQHTSSRLPIGLDLSAEAANLAGGRLRRLRAAFDVGADCVAVREFAATLPGEATFNGNGRIASKDPDQPRFEGAVTLDAPQVHATLNWLKGLGFGPLADLPENGLRHAKLQARLLAAAGRLAFDDLRGNVDGSQVSGTFGISPGQHPVIAATLSIDQLALDPWLPLSMAHVMENQVGASTDLRLTVHQARLRDETIENFGLDAAGQDDGLTIRQLDGTVRGVHAIISARVSRSGRVDHAKLIATTAEVSSLADMLPASWRTSPRLWQGPAALEMEASGPPSALAGKVVLALADATVEAEPSVDLDTGRWHSNLTLRHPGASRFLATLGLFGRLGWPGMPTWLGDGSLSMIAQLSGQPTRIALDSFDFNAGLLRAGGHLSFSLVSSQVGLEPKLEGAIRAETLPLPMPRARSQAPLPIAALRGWQAAVHVEAEHLLLGLAPVLDNCSFDLALTDGNLQVTNLEGAAAGGRVAGSMTLATKNEPPVLAVDGSIADTTIDGPIAGTAIDLEAGRLHGELRLHATGYSPAALLTTLAGDGHFSVTDGSAKGFDLARLKAAAQSNSGQVQALREALAGGQTQFDQVDLRAEARDGRIAFKQATLAGVAGSASLTGSIDLGAGLLDLRATLRPSMPEPPEAGLSLTGPVDRPQRFPDLTGFALWLAQHGQ